jgi:hypothetical protein
MGGYKFSSSKIDGVLGLQPQFIGGALKRVGEPSDENRSDGTYRNRNRFRIGPDEMEEPINWAVPDNAVVTRGLIIIGGIIIGLSCVYVGSNDQPPRSGPFGMLV